MTELPDTNVFDTVASAATLASDMGLSWLCIDGTGDVYAGENKPESHCKHALWIWLFGERPIRLGWYDLGGKDWRDCRYELDSTTGAA